MSKVGSGSAPFQNNRILQYITVKVNIIPERKVIKCRTSLIKICKGIKRRKTPEKKGERVVPG